MWMRWWGDEEGTKHTRNMANDYYGEHLHSHYLLHPASQPSTRGGRKVLNQRVRSKRKEFQKTTISSPRTRKKGDFWSQKKLFHSPIHSSIPCECNKKRLLISSWLRWSNTADLKAPNLDHHQKMREREKSRNYHLESPPGKMKQKKGGKEQKREGIERYTRSPRTKKIFWGLISQIFNSPQ